MTGSPAAVRPPRSLTFTADRGRWATEPPEHRGVARDQVRLLVARPGGIDHVRFADLERFLEPGDALVVNTSATRPAAIGAVHRADRVTVHLSTAHDDGTWTVELRRPDQSGPVLDAAVADVIDLDGGGHLRLGAPVATGPRGRGVRLWRAAVSVPGRLDTHMRLHGQPITYGATGFVLSDHQTVFARPGHTAGGGSAEMASAGRPFSHRLVTRLVSAGVRIAPITLHAGVSSQEAGEPPQPEWTEVPEDTARVVNDVRRAGGRVVAVGTTVTRALESAATDGGVVAYRGWTDLLVTPRRGAVVVDGLITGWHEADASHLLLLQAVAGAPLVQRAYDEALAGPYLWHEFGDACLLLPDRPRPTLSPRSGVRPSGDDPQEASPQPVRTANPPPGSSSSSGA